MRVFFLVALSCSQLRNFMHLVVFMLLPVGKKAQEPLCIGNVLSEIQNIPYYFSSLCVFANRTLNYADYHIALNWEIF